MGYGQYVALGGLAVLVLGVWGVHGLVVRGDDAGWHRVALLEVQVAALKQRLDAASEPPQLPRPAASEPRAPTRAVAVARTSAAQPSPAVEGKYAGPKIEPDAGPTACVEQGPLAPPEPGGEMAAVTVYVQNPRTGSLFLSGRLQKYGSGRFRYEHHRTKALNPRPQSSREAWLEHVCRTSPGYKVVVWDSGGTPNWWLQNWPPRTVLVLTGDEMGRWGLKYRGRYFGPFGDDRESFFRENATGEHPHIRLPPTVRPWFRQYYDPKQQAAFGEDALFMPLGSRAEFPDFDPAKLKPPAERAYVFSLMAALTDNSRTRLHAALNSTTLIPPARAFMHIAAQWHPELTNAEYLPPERYAQVLAESVFAPCPKGRSLETFRFYEAIEAGAIPVMELDAYAREHLPPSYLAAPVVFVDRWEDAPAKMARLYGDLPGLARRQAELAGWYRELMGGVVGRLEALLVRRGDP